ncbi:hypothetical protein [Sphingobium aquiterrae]|uniref:hypothetical protein n=1 Tax=Sphingobium aquiterrae TaxID=2038656 RepID=UPI00301AB8E1
MRGPLALALATLASAAQAQSGDIVTRLAPGDLPEAVRAAVAAMAPTTRITGAERKQRQGRVYYDVEGQTPDGADVEFDLLQEGAAFHVVEMQRDIAWGAVPAIARSAARAPFVPARVIESTQTDRSVIYELFAPGKADTPMIEVRVRNGKAERLKEAWPH